MTRRRTSSTAALAYIALQSLLATNVCAQGFDFRPELGGELRVFSQSPAFDDQFSSAQASLILTGEGRWRSADRDTRVLFEPYLRLDQQDSERSYVDIRELSYAREFESFDVLVGISQVFWGVAESRNVVDVINQLDTIEDVDEGEKLGQPMVRLSKRTKLGRFEAYYLPFFRERVFASSEGRLRTPFVVNGDGAIYERDGDETAGDVALRYSQRFGDIDFGLHTFYGTSRNPLFFAQADGVVPLYQRLRQTGVDVQYTSGPWLLKGEAVSAKIGNDRFTSAVAGFEFTFFDIKGSGVDVGLLAEYLYDDRDPNPEISPVTLFDDDLFVATRMVLNDVRDTELLAGIIVDNNTDAVQGAIEFQRRFGDSLLVEVEARFFDSSEDLFVSTLARDDYFTVRLTKYF